MHLSGLRRRYDDRLSDDDRRGCLLALVVTGVVCLSTVLSWRELRYLWSGTTVAARVLRVYEVRGRGAGTVVDFEFADPTTAAVRRHSDRLALGWQPPPGPLLVEFVPGAASYARVAGYNHRWALWVLGASLLLAAGYIGLVVREAHRPVRRKRKFLRDGPP